MLRSLLIFVLLIFLSSHTIAAKKYKCNFFGDRKDKRPFWTDSGDIHDSNKYKNYIVAKASADRRVSAELQMRDADLNARNQLATKLGSVKIRSKLRSEILVRQQDVSVSADSIVEAAIKQTQKNAVRLDEFLNRRSCLFWVLVGVETEVFEANALELVKQRNLLSEIKNQYEDFRAKKNIESIESLANTLLRTINKIDLKILEEFGYGDEVNTVRKMQQEVRNSQDVQVARRLASGDKANFDIIGKRLFVISKKISQLDKLSTSKIFNAVEGIHGVLNSIRLDGEKLNLNALVKADYLANTRELNNRINKLRKLSEKSLADKVIWATELSNITIRQKRQWLKDALIEIRESSLKQQVNLKYQVLLSDDAILQTIKVGETINNVVSIMDREGLRFQKVFSNARYDSKVCGYLPSSCMGDLSISYSCRTIYFLSKLEGLELASSCQNIPNSRLLLRFGAYWLQFYEGLYECAIKVKDLKIVNLKSSDYNLHKSYRDWEQCNK